MVYDRVRHFLTDHLLGTYCLNPLSIYSILIDMLVSVNIDPNEAFVKNGQSPILTVMSAGHVLHVFINSQLSGNKISCMAFVISIFASINLLCVSMQEPCMGLWINLN